MTSQEKLAAIAALSEQQLRTAVLIPLLIKMGYQEPFEHHHANERGKDIVCKEWDEKLEKLFFVALVVKAGDITGSVSGNDSIFTVINQVKQCFNEPYRDIYQLKEVQIDRCFIVASGRITAPVMDSALGTLKQERLDKVTTFMDGTRLISRIDKHFQEYWEEANNEKEALLKSRNSLLDNLSKVVQQLIEDPAKRAKALKLVADPRFQIEFNHFEKMSQYVADVGYQRIEVDEIDPYYSDLPLECGGVSIKSSLFELRKAARKVLYDMDEVIELLKQLATTKDPLKAFETTEELSSYVGGMGRRSFCFDADKVSEDDNFYLAITEYRERKDFLEKRGLSQFYKELAERLKATARDGLINFFKSKPKDEQTLWLCVKIEFILTEKRLIDVRPFTVEAPVLSVEHHPGFKVLQTSLVESDPGKSITIKLAAHSFAFSYPNDENPSPENKAELLISHFQDALVEAFFLMIGLREEKAAQ